MIERKLSTALTQRISLLVLTCFFLSGLTSLIYQILWTKIITKLVGTAPFAVAIVLTVFMAGLGLGSFIAARVIDRVQQPAGLIRIYGLLELFVGAYALIILPLLKICRPLYAVVYNHLFSHFFLYNFITFIGCFVILCVPVICMGATLPVLCRFYVTRLSNLGTHAGRLYGLNTIGAACGALLCGFWLINLLGVWGSLIFAVSINVFIGAACLITGYSVRNLSLRLSEDSHVAKEAFVEIEDQSSRSAESSFTVNAALLIFAVSGFCAMAYEVIWTKLIGLIVGPTTYSFTIVLVGFIAGLALGSIIFGLIADKVKDILWLLIGTQIVAGLSALLVSQWLGNSQFLFAKLIFTFQHNFVQLNLFKAAVLFAFLFVPTVLSGATFPLIGKIYTRSISNVGRSIGFAYAVNTIGAVAGSFCAGFILIPFLGKEKSLSLVTGLQLLTALIIAVSIAKSSAFRFKSVSLVICCTLGLAMCFVWPVWNRYMLADAKYHRFEGIKAYLSANSWFDLISQLTDVQPAPHDGRLVYYGDGIGGFTTVFKNEDVFGNSNYTLANSGKIDASSRIDLPTQTLAAHLPMLFHSNPKTVMVLGLASGITAGEVLNYPIEKLDILEISPQVVQASHFFDKWNGCVLSNPKTNLIIQDARAHLYLTGQKYDVIISEPSNPWVAGMSDLYTCDFFEQVCDRLNGDGIFALWLHAYQMDGQTFSLVCRTFADVFPNNLLVLTDYSGRLGDYQLVGFKGKDKLVLKNAMSKLSYTRQSKNMTLSDPRLLYRLIMSEDIRKLVGPGQINTDDHPILEYSAPRTMYCDDTSIATRINSNKLLTDETKNIVEQVASDVNSQIEFSVYLFSVFTPVFGIVDLEKATAAQRQRYAELVRAYCAKNPVDLSAFTDEQLRRRCQSVQIEALRRKNNSAN